MTALDQRRATAQAAPNPASPVAQTSVSPNTTVTQSPSADGLTSIGHHEGVTHKLTAYGPTSAAQPQLATQVPPGGGLIPADVMLGICAEMVDDLEDARKAAENRLRAYTGDDPECYGLTVHHPNVLAAIGTLQGIQQLEKAAVKNLEKAMKKHPLGPWVARTRGVGLKQAARLLASVGDPYWNAAEDRPRTVGELFSYCGVHAGTGIRTKGKQANWNSDAKMRAWLIAKQSVITRGHYREVYDAARLRYANAVHASECRRCGPSGRPALPGSLLSKGHQEARAYRIVMREILRDAWEESRHIHYLPGPPNVRHPSHSHPGNLPYDDNRGRPSE